MLESRRSEILLVGGVTLLAAALRLHDLAAEPLWSDEALTLRFARLPVAGILRDLAEIDVHPPLYYLFLKVWSALGTSELALRLPSAVFGTLTVPVVYAVGRTCGSRSAGLAGAALLALAPPHVQFAQEARSYALATLATAVATWGLAHLFTRDRDAMPTFGAALLRRGTWRRELPWWAYVGGCTLAVYTHSIAAFLPVAASGVAALWWATRGAFDRRFLASWAAANAAVLLLWLPWIPFLFTQTVEVLADTWMTPPSGRSGLRLLARAYGPGLGDAGHVFVIGGLGGLAAFGAWSWRRRPFAALLVLALAAGVPLLIYLASQWRPMFIERSLLWPSVPFLLLVGAGCVALRPRALAAATLCGLLALEAAGLARYYGEVRKEPWDEVAAYVEAHVGSDDVVIFHPADAEIPFRYYFSPSSDDVRMVSVVPSVAFHRRRVDQVELVAYDALPELFARHSRAWLVRRYARVKGGDRLHDALQAHAQRVDYHRQLNLEIVLFERMPAASDAASRQGSAAAGTQGHHPQDGEARHQRGVHERRPAAEAGHPGDGARSGGAGRQDPDEDDEHEGGHHARPEPRREREQAL